jgi:hypothetical protein
MRNVIGKNVDKIKMHFVFNNFKKNHAFLRDNMDKYCRAGHAKDDNMVHAHFTLGTKGYTHILRICDIYCLYTATLVVQTRLNITLYVH